MTGEEVPAGTPWGEVVAGRLLPVYCTHGVRWDPSPSGYVPVSVDEAHPDLPCRDVGAIPAACHPVLGYDPEDPLGV